MSNAAKTPNFVNCSSCFFLDGVDPIHPRGEDRDVCDEIPIARRPTSSDLLHGDFLENVDPHIRLKLEPALIGVFVV